MIAQSAHVWQVCDHVNVYGVSVSKGGTDDIMNIDRIGWDSDLHGTSDETECCYYPLEEDYNPEAWLLEIWGT